MKVLVTGGSGYTGGIVVAHLVAAELGWVPRKPDRPTIVTDGRR
jgi:uncharacterized protein YbjT (DUF2867 family)